MRFARVRSGLAESFDEVEAIALDRSGTVLFVSGDPDRPLFYRSAIKPLQALAASRTGLALPPEHLALSCSSHGGHPIHIATARQILHDAGLTEHDLLCTPGRPLSGKADGDLIAAGNRHKRRILHNCSGKHAGWLAACMTAGWDTATYLDVDHPLQLSIVEIVHEFTGVDPLPVGVDGCGAPTLRGSLRGLAQAFSSLGTVPELDPIARAMSRFGSLIADNVRSDGRVGTTWGGPQKVGAEGSFAMVRSGVAIATKSMSGDSDNAVAGALRVAELLGMLSDHMRTTLAQQMSPVVIGAGVPVGSLEPVTA